MKKFIIGVLLFCIQSSIVSAQFFKKEKPTFFASYGIGASDQRLFDWANGFFQGEALLKREGQTFDSQFECGIKRSIYSANRIQFNIGVGQSTFLTNFSRPFKKTLLGGDLTKEFRFMDAYLKNSLVVPISLSISPIRKSPLLIECSFPSYFVVRKWVRSRNENFSKWMFDYEKQDLNLGIGLRALSSSFVFQYRAMHLSKIDRIVFNDIIIYDLNDVFFDQKFDRHNPATFVFTYTRRIGK